VKSSLQSSLISLKPQQMARAVQDLTEYEAQQLLYDWRLWASPNQIPPPGILEDLAYIIAGAGGEKQGSGAEWVKGSGTEPRQASHVALVGSTSADCRKTMVEGDAGILLSVFPPEIRPRYEPSRRQITFANGAIAITYPSEEPNLLRGPAHDAAWVDELASFYDADVDETVSEGM
jgi:phage terminase large subunit-like protein